MTPAARTLSVVAVLAGTSAASASSINVILDADHQGEGNKGAAYRPLDEFGQAADVVLTARTTIDHESPFDLTAPGAGGTIYIDKEDIGAGVQDHERKGSKGISGGGGHKDEEIVFTFDTAVAASGLRLGINEFEAGHGLDDKDDTVLFIRLAGVSETIMLDESDFLPAFDLGTHEDRGTVDFGRLGLGAGAMVESFAVRETNDHIYVNFVGYGPGSVVPLPAPVALGLAGLAGVAVVRRKRR